MQTNKVQQHKSTHIDNFFAKSRRKICFSRFRQQFNKFCRLYCGGTHVHGLHYITDLDSSLFQSIFFTLTATISLVICCTMINIQLSRFEGNTLTTYIASTAYPVWENPFPAVTICNFNVVYKSHTKHVADILKNHSIGEDTINDFFGNLAKLINYELSDSYDVETYNHITEILDNVGYDVEKLMLEVSDPCSRLLKTCTWKTKQQRCSELFNVVKTTQGFCCSFNYYGLRDYQIASANDDDVRRFAGAAGPTFGLSVEMTVEEDQYVSTVTPVHGVNVLVHDGQNFPDMSVSSSSLMPNQIMTLGVKPSVLEGYPNIRRLNDYERGCRFQDEGALKWSDIYSYETCLSECKVEAIFDMCGCVPFFYPNLEIFNNLVIANMFGEENSKKIKKRMGEVKLCHCLPRCNEVKFEIYIDKRTGPRPKYSENGNLSILNVYYNSISCMKMSTSLYITWDMLLASIGGIFGLCLGGSVMSVVEITYHLATCFLCDGVQVKKQKNKAQKKAKVNLPKEDPKFVTSLTEYLR